jgi:D-tyrosyl-tRNA(Tyr) deacylase
MKTVIQRVLQASVTISGVQRSAISKGLLVLVGFEDADGPEDLSWISRKIVNMRLFDDENKVPNVSLLETGGDLLLVSQFTLQASTKKGNRPSYIKASKPEVAIPLYESFITMLETELGKKIQTGVFGADMQVALMNDGPVTLVMDSKNKD